MKRGSSSDPQPPLRCHPARAGMNPSRIAASTFAPRSRWLAPRSAHQMMAGAARELLHDPRHLISKATEHSLRTRRLKDQLRCVRARKPKSGGTAIRWSSRLRVQRVSQNGSVPSDAEPEGTRG